VALHSPERDWDKATSPFQVFESQGERQADARVQFPDRAYCFDQTKATSIDCVVTDH
jgi:hypothetical protein